MMICNSSSTSLLHCGWNDYIVRIVPDVCSHLDRVLRGLGTQKKNAQAPRESGGQFLKESLDTGVRDARVEREKDANAAREVNKYHLGRQGPGAPVPLRPRNWSPSRKHAQNAISILQTFWPDQSGRCPVELAVKFERVRWLSR